MIIEGSPYICPECGGTLKHEGRVKRIVRSEYGKVEQIWIKRLKCLKCGMVHRVLPSHLIPFKHFKANIIDGVQQGSITSNDLGYEDYPCELTMKRWKNIGNE